MVKGKLQTFLDDRDDNWPIHLASPQQLEAFAIAVTDDNDAVQAAFDRLTTEVFNELFTEAHRDIRPPVPQPAAAKTA
jgi:hypothetical protein